MRDSFSQAIQFVLKWETMGGQVIYTNNMNDPGGPTKWGISSRAYPQLDIISLSKEDAILIYLNDYWIKAGCDLLRFPIDIAVFNFAVTCGVGAALKIRARAGGGLPDFLIEGISYYVALKGQVLEGWINRSVDLWRTFGLDIEREEAQLPGWNISASIPFTT